jgi:RNA polymerase-interacting CarD/CdnL/TRCF family regulator
MITGPNGKEGHMAEQHGMQPEHHTPVPEKEFYDRARQRLDQALRNIDELEEQMAKRLGRSRESERKAAD